MVSLPLFQQFPDRPKLVGIARIAADSETLREGHNVEYFTLGTRSLLSRVVSSRRTRYADRSFLPKGYGQRLSQLMAALRKKYGFEKAHATRSRAANYEVEQMGLF